MARRKQDRNVRFEARPAETFDFFHSRQQRGGREKRRDKTRAKFELARGQPDRSLPRRPEQQELDWISFGGAPG